MLYIEADCECPICLDSFPFTSCTLLTCGHQVCTACWTRYGELAGQVGGRVGGVGQGLGAGLGQGVTALACPLCRHEEFVEVVRTYRVRYMEHSGTGVSSSSTSTSV